MTRSTRAGRAGHGAAHPLAQAAASLRARDAGQVIELGPPSTPDWVLLADLDRDGGVERWLDAAARGPDARRPPAVAASYLASWLGSCVTGPAAALLVLHGVLPEVSPTNLWLRRGPAGGFDAVAFDRTAFWCATDHAAAAHPDARPAPSRDALVGRLAAGAVECLTPLFARIRALAPYGRHGMWGAVADGLAAGLMWITRRADGDASEQRMAWAALDSVVEAIAARVPQLRGRPLPVEVGWSAGTTIFCRRSTCCLYYKSPEARAYAPADRYCSSCPLRDPEDQRRRWASWLEATARSETS